MVMVLVVGGLWAGIGYVYTGHIVSGALLWGGAVTAAGWVIVAVAVAIEVLRLERRRRRSSAPWGE